MTQTTFNFDGISREVRRTLPLSVSVVAYGMVFGGWRVVSPERYVMEIEVTNLVTIFGIALVT